MVQSRPKCKWLFSFKIRVCTFFVLNLHICLLLYWTHLSPEYCIISFFKKKSFLKAFSLSFREKKRPPGAVSLFPGGADPFGKKPSDSKKEEPKKTEEVIRRPPAKSISMFDDDDEDNDDNLFGSGKSTSQKPVRTFNMFVVVTVVTR